jgi:hypothetical protein
MLPLVCLSTASLAFGIYVSMVGVSENAFGVSGNAKEGKEPARLGPPRLEGVADGLTGRTSANPSKPSLAPEVSLADPRARKDPRWVLYLQRAAGNKSVSALLATTKTEGHPSSATTGEMLRPLQHQTRDGEVACAVPRECDEGKAGSQPSGGRGGGTAGGKDGVQQRAVTAEGTLAPAASSGAALVQRAPRGELQPLRPFPAEASDAATRHKKATDEVNASLKTGHAELDQRAKERVHAGDDLNKLWQTITSSHDFDSPLPRLWYSRYFLKHYFTASTGQPPDPDALYYKLVEIEETYLHKATTELEAARTARESARKAAEESIRREEIAKEESILREEIAKLEKQETFAKHPGKVHDKLYFIGLTPATALAFANPEFVAVVESLYYFVPIFGEALAVTEAIIGRSAFTGEKLSLLDRVLLGLPLVGPVLRGGRIVIKGVTIALRTAAQRAAFIVAMGWKTGKTSAQTLALLIKLEGAAEHIGELRKLRDAVAEVRPLAELELKELKSLEESLGGKGKSARTHPASGEGGQAGKAVKPLESKAIEIESDIDLKSAKWAKRRGTKAQTVYEVKKASGVASDQAEVRMGELFAKDGHTVRFNADDAAGDLTVDGVRADVKLLTQKKSILSAVERGAGQAPNVIIDGTIVKITSGDTASLIEAFEAEAAKHPGKFRNIEKIYMAEGDGTIYIYHRKGAAPLKSPR